MIKLPRRDLTKTSQYKPILFSKNSSTIHKSDSGSRKRIAHITILDQNMVVYKKIITSEISRSQKKLAYAQALN